MGFFIRIVFCFLDLIPNNMQGFKYPIEHYSIVLMKIIRIL